MPRHGGDLRLITCAVCSSQVMKPRHVKTCSRQCGIQLRHARKLQVLCGLCGAKFEIGGYGSTRLLCSDCRARAGGQRLVELICPVCGWHGWRQSRFRTCSRECGNRLQWQARKRWANRQEADAAKLATRRMRMRNTTGAIEAINPDDLFRRDNGKCGICSCDVSRDQVSIDHVVPLSKGGSHTWSNVQLAHLRCNIRRGNRDRPKPNIEVRP